MGRDDISARCSAIEECYEFMLAYAGQGLAGKKIARPVRRCGNILNGAVAAITGLVDSYAGAVKEENLQPAERYLVYLAVLDDDARTPSPRFSWFSPRRPSARN